jgi:hypothetical protein
VQHCTNCGAPRDAGANFCGNCGHRFADEPADDTPYGGEMTVAAVLLSLFMPLIALIVALVMRAGELRPSRRGFLKSWAIASWSSRASRAAPAAARAGSTGSPCPRS